jgi:hypothetical protein
MCESTKVKKKGERILVRMVGDKTFSAGVLDICVFEDGRLGVIANKGFEILIITSQEEV